MGDETAWRPLYRLGAIAAIVVLALVPVQLAIYLAEPPPSTVTGWFELYERNPWLGLAHMDLLLVIDQVLFAILFLALCVSLRNVSRSWSAVGLLLAVLAAAAYLSSNRAIEMLTLSDAFAAAASEAERASALAAGQAMVATWTGTAFSVGYVVAAVAFLIVSVLMLRSDVYSRLTGWVGVVFGASSLVPASAGTVGLIFSIASLLPMWLWFVLLARRLPRLGRT